MNKIDALGFIEVRGLVTAIEAADAMLKSANVRLLRQHTVNPGLISLVVEGDLAACRAAVDAGAGAAVRLGDLISRHVIGRPDIDCEEMVLGKVGSLGGVEPPKPASPVSETIVVKTDLVVVISQEEEPSNQKVEAVKTAEKAGGMAASIAKPTVAEEKKSQKTAASAPGISKAVMEFIFSAGHKGRSWSEISKRFPKHTQLLRTQLDAEVGAGQLIKAGVRYRKPGSVE